MFELILEMADRNKKKINITHSIKAPTELAWKLCEIIIMNFPLAFSYEYQNIRIQSGFRSDLNAMPRWAGSSIWWPDIWGNVPIFHMYISLS